MPSGIAVSFCLGAKVPVPNLDGRCVAQEVELCIRAFSERLGAEVLELNIQFDHVHLLAIVPPKVSISEFVGTLKGRTAVRIFNKFRNLKHKPYVSVP